MHAYMHAYWIQYRGRPRRRLYLVLVGEKDATFILYEKARRNVFPQQGVVRVLLYVRGGGGGDDLQLPSPMRR